MKRRILRFQEFMIRKGTIKLQNRNAYWQKPDTS